MTWRGRLGGAPNRSYLDSMIAGYYDQTGAPHEVIHVGDVPTPEPHEGEVRVRVHVSAVNPSDVKQRSGWAGRTPTGRTIPHNDGSGVIDAVGGGVARERIGQRVWLYEAGRDGRSFGTAAQYFVGPAALAVPLPAKANFDFGATLGVPAMTAHRTVFADGPVTGQTVLVAGGAGSVGRFAVQFAKWGGARVIATAGSEAQAAVAEAAGADAVVLYTADDATAQIAGIARSMPSGGIDRIVEVAFGRNIAMDVELLRTNGIIAAYASSNDPGKQPRVPATAMLVKGVLLRWILVYVMPQDAKERAIADIAQAIDDGAIDARIARRFPLAQLADAHEMVGIAGAGGKVLVDIP